MHELQSCDQTPIEFGAEPNILRCGSSRAENICKHTCTADTHNGYFANGKTLSFDNKAPAKGDVFAAIAEFVFH